MEEAFKTLKAKEKNNLEGVIKWMKDAQIIDGKDISEDKVKKAFDNVKGSIEIDKFKECLNKLAKDTKTNVDLFTTKLLDTEMVLEDAFENMKKEGKDNVDSVIQWMKDSKLMGDAKEAEEKARKLLEDVKDKQHVELEILKDTVHKIAEDTEQQLSGVAKMIKEKAPKLREAATSAAKAGVSAFMDAMK